MRSSLDLIWCWPVSAQNVKFHSLGCVSPCILNFPIQSDYAAWGVARSHELTGLVLRYMIYL